MTPPSSYPDTSVGSSVDRSVGTSTDRSAGPSPDKVYEKPGDRSRDDALENALGASGVGQPMEDDLPVGPDGDGDEVDRIYAPVPAQLAPPPPVAGWWTAGCVYSRVFSAFCHECLFLQSPPSK